MNYQKRLCKIESILIWWRGALIEVQEDVISLTNGDIIAKMD